MNLEDLIAQGAPDHPAINRRGGRTSVDPNAATADMHAEFARLAAPLAAQPFWNAAVDQASYLPTEGLWAPQRRAVGVALASVAARRTSGFGAGAALVKMPTGTGKTGVIATLACAVPEIRRTLVITPRKALVDQMVRDLHTRLWSRFGRIYDGSGVRARASGDPAVGVAVKDGPVRRLLPSNAKELSEIADERIVMVGTFAALEQILRPDRPAHRLTGRRPVWPDAVPPDNDAGELEPEEAARQALVTMLRGFDLVIVDESHYEPAFIWSQCIRSLGRPTVLFSATPYRNDFRFFEIDGRFAFNLSFQEARDRHLIRDVRVESGSERPPGETFAQRLVRFAGEVGAEVLPDSPGAARVIVRGDGYESLEKLRAQLEALGERCVLIHHKEKRNDPKTLRFHDAIKALDAAETQDVRFWLHQWKLLEGVDDSRFCGVAMLEPFATSRAVIQQVGRVLRYHRRDRDEAAIVIGDGEIADDLSARFGRYLSYEERFDAAPGDALRRETNFFQTLRDASPAVQYISGDFRDRLDIDDSAVSFSDIQIPMRTFITRWDRRLTLDEIAEASALAMGLEDRHDATVLHPGADDPTNVRLIVYVAWGNSPLLTKKAMPSWTLGVMVIVEVGSRIFLLDTERLVVDPELLGLEPEGPEALQRLVPTSSDDEKWRVTVASAVSLDISDMGVRGVTARMRDFSNAFYDLAQGMQATTSVRALMTSPTGPSASRYLSLQRATVSDARSGYVSITDFAEWIDDIAARLDSMVVPSRTFARFAQALPAPAADKAQAQNILFDFAEFINEDGSRVPDGWDPAKTQQLAHADRCLDVDDDGKFTITVGEDTFDGEIKYKVTGTVRRRGRYAIDIPHLDAFLIGRDADAVRQREKAQLLSGMVSRNQAFRVVPADPAMVYAQEHFYRPSIAIDIVAKDEPGGPLETVSGSDWMEAVTSEKGNGTSTKDEWVDGSIFGGVYAHFGFANRGRPDRSRLDAIRVRDPKLADLLDEFSIVVCDDGGTEICDFLCVDQTRSRVVMIHAKVADTRMSLNSLQEVGRQAQAGLGFLTSVHDLHDRTAVWNTRVLIEDGHLTRRVLKGANVKDAWVACRDAMRSARYAREVWILAGQIMKRSYLVNQLQRKPPTPKVRQMTYYLASLQTSAARANVGMRIFCSP